MCNKSTKIFNNRYLKNKITNNKMERIAVRKGILVYFMEKSAISVSGIVLEIKKMFSKHKLVDFFVWLSGNNIYIYFCCLIKIETQRLGFFDIYGTSPSDIYSLDRNFSAVSIANVLSELNNLIKDNTQGEIFLADNSFNLIKSLGFDGLINISNFKQSIEPEKVASITLTSLKDENIKIGSTFNSVKNFSELLLRYNITLNDNLVFSDDKSEKTLGVNDYITTQFHRFFNRFKEIEEILLSDNTLENKQLAIEEQSCAYKVASQSLKYTLSQEHQKIVVFIDALIGSADSFKDLVDPYLMPRIYTHLSLESSKYFYKPEFELTDKLTAFNNDPLLFAKNHCFPSQEKVHRYPNSLVVFYFVKIFEFIKCSLGMLFTHLVVQELSNLQSHFTNENDQDKKVLFAVLPFQQKVIGKIFSCYKQSLRVNQVQKDDFLINLTEFLEKTRNKLIVENPDCSILPYLSKPFGVSTFETKSFLTLGDDPFESLICNDDIRMELGTLLFTCLETINICQVDIVKNYVTKDKTVHNVSKYSFSRRTLDFLLRPGLKWLETENWPLIVKPKDWQLKSACIYVDDQNRHQKTYVADQMQLKCAENTTPIFYKDIVLGGYHYNDSADSAVIKAGNSAIKIISLGSYANISGKTVEAINHLQLTKFRIDLKFLNYVQTNFIKCLLNYIEYNSAGPETKHLYVLKDVNHSIIRGLGSVGIDYDKCMYLEVLPLDIFINSYPEVLRLKKLKAAGEPNPALMGEQARLLETYVNEVNNLMSFFEIFFTSKIFSSFDIYFSYFLDFRGRIYYLARFLSFQDRNFSRAFLDIGFFDDTIDCSTEVQNYSNNQLSVFQTEMEKSTREAFLYLKHSQNNICSVFSLDVTASGFQILAALTGNEELLLKTNFVVRNNDILTSKIDFYSVILEKFLLKFDLFLNKDELFNKISFFKKLKKVVLEETESKHIDFLVEMSLKIMGEIKKHFNRKAVKNLLMPFIYSQGPKAAVDNLISWVKSSIFLGNFRVKLTNFYDTFSIKEEYKLTIHEILKNVLVLLRSGVLEVLDENFPGVMTFKKYMEKTFWLNERNICDIKKGVLLKTSPGSTGTYSFFSILKKKTFRYYRYSNFFKKAISVNFVSYPMTFKEAEFDKIKAAHCIMPNLIHFLDAETLVETISDLRLKNINVAVAHDCVYCLPYDLNSVKTAYFNAVIKVLFEKDAFETFVIANRYNRFLKPLDMELIGFFRKNRLIILDKIRSGQLKMSDFILTP